MNPFNMKSLNGFSGLPSLDSYVDFGGSMKIYHIQNLVDATASLTFFNSGISKLPKRGNKIVISRISGNPFNLTKIYNETENPNNFYILSNTYIKTLKDPSTFDIINAWIVVLYDGIFTDFMIYTNGISFDLYGISFGFFGYTILR